MPERIILLAFVLAGIFILVKKIFNKTSKSTDSMVLDIIGADAALPTIVYFWTEQCSQCFSLQKPALSRLKRNHNNFNLIAYDAFKKVELIKILNIKTVPSTVVLSRLNEVRFINNGFASEILLASQLGEI